jgi:hypothetical protein
MSPTDIYIKALIIRLASSNDVSSITFCIMFLEPLATKCNNTTIYCTVNTYKYFTATQLAFELIFFCLLSNIKIQDGL